MAYDLLIKNGRVVDGSGAPAFHADVAVQDGKIVGVGKANGAAAKRTIDAAGCVVAPGFIDHHTHFDPQAVWDPYCGSWLQNGHTTVIVGQCGQVIAPVRPGDAEWYLTSSPMPNRSRCRCEGRLDVTWESVGDYLNALGSASMPAPVAIRASAACHGRASSERSRRPMKKSGNAADPRAMYDGALGSRRRQDRGDPPAIATTTSAGAAGAAELGIGSSDRRRPPAALGDPRRCARIGGAHRWLSIYNLMSNRSATR